MTDSTTPQDGKAMPPASAGSVGEPRNGAPSACETVRFEPEPLAWAVIGSGETEGHVAGLCDTRLEAEMRIARLDEVGDCARARTMLVVPLYRSPTLADAERDAVEVAAKFMDKWGGVPNTIVSDTLRGLLERTK